jgi:hypothetical protein
LRDIRSEKFILSFMKWLRDFLVPTLALVIVFSSVASAADDASGPAAVTRAAYRTALAHFGFDPAAVKAQQGRLTPDLYARLLKKANQPTPPGDAPDIEGDVFLDSQDVPTKWEVGEAAVDGTKAKVRVTLQWDKEKRHYSVLLAQVDGAWKIYDIVYGTDGKLTDLLK